MPVVGGRRGAHCAARYTPLVQLLLHVLLLEQASGFAAPGAHSLSAISAQRCIRPVLALPEGDEANSAQPDVTRASSDLEPDQQLPDGRLRLPRIDRRYVVFIGLFLIGSDRLLEWSKPIREIEIGGVRPFDAILSTLAGPLVQTTPKVDAIGIEYGSETSGTLGLALVVCFFAYRNLLPAVQRALRGDQSDRGQE